MKPGRNYQEIASGLIFASVGIAAIIVALNYPFGTIVRMGPGFVPVMLGAILTLLGIAAAVQGSRLPRVSLNLLPRPLVFVLGGILVWVLLIERAGFIPSTLALLLLSAQAEPEITPLESLLLAAGVTLLGYVLFIRGIGIPIPAFGS